MNISVNISSSKQMLYSCKRKGTQVPRLPLFKLILSELTKREPQYGYTVVFHDHESYSSTIPSGFWLSPGSIYKVDLSLTKVRFYCHIVYPHF